VHRRLVEERKQRGADLTAANAAAPAAAPGERRTEARAERRPERRPVASWTPAESRTAEVGATSVVVAEEPVVEVLVGKLVGVLVTHVGSPCRSLVFDQDIS
jgi:hypothetical protein